MTKKLTIDFKLGFTALEDQLYEQSFQFVCGVDEAGRGPLAGPVVAAALIMPNDCQLEGLDDSKKLSPLRRQKLFDEIVERDLICSVGIIDHECIDQINILQASLMAMRKAVRDLKQSPDFVLVDGIHPIPKLTQPQYAVVKGDSRCRAIAAASIVAKVTRDKIMDKYEALYPSFSFSQHKGYPTAKHMDELREHGPTEIHRRTFRPVTELLEQYAIT